VVQDGVKVDVSPLTPVWPTPLALTVNALEERTL